MEPEPIRVVQGPDGPRVAAHNPDALRGSGCATAVLLIFFLVLSTFFTGGGISLVLAGEWAGLPFAVGSGYVQVGVALIVWANRVVARSLDLGGTVTVRAVARAYRVYHGVRAGCFVVLGALAAIGLVIVFVGAADGKSPVVLGLMLLPAALMAGLLLIVAGLTRALCRSYERHYPVLTG
ncbi:hypothetical protein [Cryptosporangium aurantiacum]|uniref:Uncharacterized protein n=1 Tax=Cryptosporangium aurantiacum TaxID=134849 RepID=A0A1M7RB59_9ACTN|nr:hypothetical protein [Cryptosporangium aurantiacum]SHN43362.1 hypothetical protein SAMN05443668_109129 [Cryptosporangium aurantiacum]